MTSISDFEVSKFSILNLIINSEKYWKKLVSKNIIFFTTYLILNSFFLISNYNESYAQDRLSLIDPFIVSGIKVDVTDKTADLARKKALRIGEAQAFLTLLKRLTMRIDHTRLPVLNEDEISGYLQEFNILTEKNSKTRYIADLLFKFKANDIRLLLRDSEVAFAETISRPILVLPVYNVAGAVALWDNPNPWRVAWRRLIDNDDVYAQGLISIILAKGDLGDLATISAEVAVKGDKESLMDIAKKYGVKTTLVAISSISFTPEGNRSFDVNIIKYGQKGSQKLLSHHDVPKNNKKISEIMYASVKKVYVELNETWKQKNLLQFDKTGVVGVSLSIKNLEDWVTARRRISRVPVVEKLEVVLFSKHLIRLKIQFIGHISKLKSALMLEDIKLIEKEGDWYISSKKKVSEITIE